eukprot:3901674-Amphidinium_carterae.1
MPGSSETLFFEVLSSASSLTHRVFREVESLPWSLCRGDLEANVRSLLTGPKPEEPLSGKLWDVGKAGLASQASLVQVLDLLGQTSWSSSHAEKMHASCALVRKHHPECGGQTLSLRAFIHMARELLPGKVCVDKELRTLQRRMSALLDKRPVHISGRQGFFAEVMKKKLVSNKRRTDVADKTYSQQTTMKLHGKYWAGLSHGIRAGFEKKAVERRGLAERDRHENLVGPKHLK